MKEMDKQTREELLNERKTGKPYRDAEKWMKKRGIQRRSENANTELRLDRPVVALVGWIASVLATAMAAIRQTDISLCLAAFAGSLMFASCSWSTDGTKGEIRRLFACLVVVTTTFTFIAFTIVLSTDHLTAGSGIARVWQSSLFYGLC